MLSVTSEQVDIDVREVYRYLGYKGNEPEEHIAETIAECIREVKKVSELRSFCRDFPFSCKGNAAAEVDPTSEVAFVVELTSEDATEVDHVESDCGETATSESDPGIVSIGSVRIESKALAKHLKSCVKVYVFGATIGIGLDRLIARASINDMTKATIYQAVGAAYIEAYCDVINRELDHIAAADDKGTRPRFSPGYGDFDIRYQSDIFKLLDLTKHTGISLTEGMLMTPSKSVTAIVGVTCESVTYRTGHSCERCDLMDCPFREEI